MLAFFDRFGNLQRRIISAVKRGSHRTVAALLARDPDLVNASDSEQGGTPLHWAAIHARKQVAETLISAGADVNARDGSLGRTALHWAAYPNPRRPAPNEVIHLLLAHGADVNATDTEGSTPLDVAGGMSNQHASEILRDHGAKWEYDDHWSASFVDNEAEDASRKDRSDNSG